MSFIPSDETIEDTVVLGFRQAITMMGRDPLSVESEDVLRYFRAWVAAKVAASPEAAFVREFGERWDRITSTDEYMDFADDVGTSLDWLRGNARNE